jgi:curved DNA-binding protein CbpA
MTLFCCLGRMFSPKSRRGCTSVGVSHCIIKEKKVMDYPTACQWLGVASDVEIDEAALKVAFRKAAMREHPDKSSHENATQRFQSIKRAHELLVQCVARGETGLNANRQRTDEDDDGFGGAKDDLHEAMLAHLFFRMHFGGGHPGMHVQTGGMPFRGGSGFASGFSYYYDEDDDDEDDDNYNRYMDHMYSHAREKEEQKAARAAEARRKEAQQRQQAAAEGRDFFEEWTAKALQQEATKRHLGNLRGLEKQSLVELIIEDETSKRRRRELKEKAPLLDEWVEIYNLQEKQHLNGMKARAIDFSDGELLPAS